MHELLSSFGFNIIANSLGEAWLDLVDIIIHHGSPCFDEKRARRAITNVRIKITQHSFPDALLTAYGDAEKIQKMLDFTFKEPQIYDIDHSPSFTIPSKSYFQRLKEGNMLHFVVERLALIPESKKAVISFPTYDDYKLILQNQKNDYLPCLVMIQFRLRKDVQNKYVLDTNFYSRSMDAYQKGHGNLATLSVISEEVAKQLSDKIHEEILTGFIDGIIADAHIYDDTLATAAAAFECYIKGKK